MAEENRSHSSEPTTPSGRSPSIPPQFTALLPPSARPAPARAPTRQWPELQGSPHHRVSRLHTRAASVAAARTLSIWSDGTTTMPLMVAATAVPTTRAPTTWSAAAPSTAGPGRIARVTTGAAMAFPASWTPFTMAKAPASAITTTTTDRTLLDTVALSAGRHSGAPLDGWIGPSAPLHRN